MNQRRSDPAWKNATSETAPWHLWVHAVEVAAIKKGADGEIVRRSSRIRSILRRAFDHGEPVWMAADEVAFVAKAEARPTRSAREELRAAMIASERARRRDPRRATPYERRLLRQALRRFKGPVLSNGLPKKRHADPAQFDPDQLAIGVKVELEHTNRPEVALEIAMAHLLERHDYYERLERMEKSPVRGYVKRRRRT